MVVEAGGRAQGEEFTCQPELKDGGIARARARETQSARFSQSRCLVDRLVPISRCCAKRIHCPDLRPQIDPPKSHLVGEEAAAFGLSPIKTER